MTRGEGPQRLRNPVERLLRWRRGRGQRGARDGAPVGSGGDEGGSEHGRDDGRRRRLGPAYQGAAEATLAVVIALGIGIWADTKLDTSPAGMLIGLAVGFGSFVLRLWRLAQELNTQQRTTGTEDPEDPKDER